MIFKNLFKNETPIQTDLMNPVTWFSDMLGGAKTASGVPVTPASSLKVPTVFACVNILANAVAKLPFQLFEHTKTGRSRNKKHAVYRLLEKRPNPMQTPFSFKHTYEVHRLLWGNAYINIEWDVWGYPKNLWLLNPANTEPILDIKTQQVWYYTVLPDGTSTFLPSSDVIHLKTLSLDGIKGKSMIQIARELIGSSQAAQQFKGKFFSNGAANNGVLKIAGQLSPEAKDAIRQEWENKNTGIENAHRIAILDAGLEFQDIGMPLRDAQFIEGMNYDKSEIATIFNIPLYKVNNLDKATLNNVEQMAIEFLSDTLDPIITQYEEEFTYKLFTVKEQEKYYLKFNIGKLMRTDSKTRAEYYKIMSEIGAFSINGILELEDMDGIDGGDVHRVDLNHVDIKYANEYQLAKAGLKGGENGNEQGDEGSSSETSGQEPDN